MYISRSNQTDYTEFRRKNVHIRWGDRAQYRILRGYCVVLFMLVAATTKATVEREREREKVIRGAAYFYKVDE